MLKCHGGKEPYSRKEKGGRKMVCGIKLAIKVLKCHGGKEPYSRKEKGGRKMVCGIKLAI